jgi:hypothetical protein
LLKVGVSTGEVKIIRAPGRGLDNGRVFLSLYAYIYTYIELLCKMNRGVGSPSMTAREVAKAPCLRVKYNFKNGLVHNDMTLLK